MYQFEYHKPSSLADSIELFNKLEFPKYLAGGMTLIPAMKQKLSSPTDLIDLQNIDELKGINKSKDNTIIVGAFSSHNEIANSLLIKNNIKGLSYLASKIADNAVRNCGTIGGSICNADPAADYPAALLSLEATINTNNRSIPAKDFFIDMFETKLESHEIVTSITFPIKSKSFYLKFSSQASKYAIVGMFACIVNDQLSVSMGREKSEKYTQGTGALANKQVEQTVDSIQAAYTIGGATLGIVNTQADDADYITSRESKATVFSMALAF